jgi:anti-anti-sigma factor
MAEPIRTTATTWSVDDAAVAPLSVTEQRNPDHRVVVAVHGEVDLSNISLLRNNLAGYDQERWLVVDMSGVRFCGVVGARLLHTMAVESSVAGRRFDVVTNPVLARLLALTGLADDITQRASLDSVGEATSPARNVAHGHPR